MLAFDDGAIARVLIAATRFERDADRVALLERFAERADPPGRRTTNVAPGRPRGVAIARRGETSALPRAPPGAGRVRPTPGHPRFGGRRKPHRGKPAAGGPPMRRTLIAVAIALPARTLCPFHRNAARRQCEQ